MKKKENIQLINLSNFRLNYAIDKYTVLKMGKFETKGQIASLFMGAAGVAILLILLVNAEVMFYSHIFCVYFPFLIMPYAFQCLIFLLIRFKTSNAFVN